MHVLTRVILLQVAILSSPFYKYNETDRILFKELALNLGMALVGIAIIGAVLLIHPLAVAIMLLCIALVDLGLFAEMWVLDISLNTVSVVNLVMAVGLSVDYSMYILHSFLGKTGTSRQERVQAAMLHIGSAVFMGLVSTMLGVVVLAGSQSHILRVFFQLLFGTCLFGGIVGLLVLPALLTYIGPRPCLAQEEEGRVSDSYSKGAKADSAVEGAV
jgi:predicted RND superfamily exporter protein